VGSFVRQVNADGTVVCGVGSGGGGVTGVTASAPLSSSGGAAPNLSMSAASAGASGYLSQADWAAFNAKVQSVGATAPLSSSGGATPTLSMTAAGSASGGYLTAADWNAFNTKISSVSAGAGISVTGTTTPTVSAAFGNTAGTVTQGNDPRLSDARPPTAASPSYIQNQNSLPQAASFSISGSGAVGNLTANGTVRLGSGGGTFSAIKRATFAWDPPAVASGGSTSLLWPLPETGAVIGTIVPSTGLSCGGPFGGCTYEVSTVYYFNQDTSAKLSLVFRNADTVTRDPPAATWTVFYITP
jgi:hypothetical protein